MSRDAGPELVRTEATVLEAVRPHLHWPAIPHVVALDPDGSDTGWPTLVSTRVPGRVVVSLSGMSPRALVRGLGDVHRAVAAARVPEPGLPRFRPWTVPPLQVPAYTAAPDAWEVAIAALEALPDGVPASQDWRLVHRDLHPANVLWSAGRPSGLVDWLNGCIGPVESDVARCRVNLAVISGLEVADDFLEHVSDLVPAYDRRWDLLVCAEFLPDPVILTTLAELGAVVDAARARAAVDAVVVAAVQRLAAG